MQAKRKLKILTQRGKTIRIEDEEDRPISSLPEKVDYWQNMDSTFFSEEVAEIARNLIRARLIESREPKPFSFVTHAELWKFRSDLDEMKASVRDLGAKVDELQGIFPKVVVLEEISKEEARKRVEEYFKEHGQADIEELTVNLKIPVQTIVEIIDDMKSEGKLIPKGETET